MAFVYLLVNVTSFFLSCIAYAYLFGNNLAKMNMQFSSIIYNSIYTCKFMYLSINSNIDKLIFNKN